ncbi:MarR family winged helix-turn-helix transcriptional regulator [Rhodovulum marinum]|uniref:DNA-binding MarR family transcriptional regulator n=1 Tax=Rhodovulum marinum TaxID=320662 RepID=A0A4V2SRI5_9RHOB|nr:MarR family transcriptional regulator [Rhodovulum marinum]TCP43156.1 DNA-binding MarR family transcriptional regulator [Rhodovulum marinum]
MNEITQNGFDRSDLAVALLMERIVRGAYDTRQSHEIQPLQWSILRYLARYPAEGRTLTRIATYLDLTHAPISRALRTLRGRGLVSTEANPADARSSILSLTEAGWAALELDPIRKIAQRVAALPEPDRDAVKRALRVMAVRQDPEDT